MSSDVVSHLSDDVGTDTQPVDFPFGSLRHSLLPAQLVQVKLLQAPSLAELELAVAEWVQSSQSIVVVPGPVAQADGVFRLAVTYVPAYQKGV